MALQGSRQVSEDLNKFKERKSRIPEVLGTFDVKIACGMQLRNI